MYIQPILYYLVKSFKSIAIFCILLSSTNFSYATHLMGSDITYRCLGTNAYEITLKIYRDCIGIDLKTNQWIDISCAKNPLTTLGNIVFKRFQIKDITGINPSGVKTLCQNGVFKFGVEEHTYRDTITIPEDIAEKCDIFRVSWALTNRNKSITTGAGNKRFYTEALIYTKLGECNSSPIFITPATTFVCLGNDFVFNNGAIDTIDNDVLTFKLVDPLSDAGKPLPYLNPYSAQKPLQFLGFPNAEAPIPQGFHLDEETGNLNFRPTLANQVSVMVIEVTEWREIDGQMKIVGKTRRDIQLIVINCHGNILPVIQAKDDTVCVGEQINIHIGTFDKNQGDSVKLIWSESVQGAEFKLLKSADPKKDSAVISWTPNEAHIRKAPHNFIVTAKDNARPYLGIAVKAIKVFVASLPEASFEVNKKEQCFKGHSFNFTNTSTAKKGEIAGSVWRFSDNQPERKELNASNVAFSMPDTFEVKLITITKKGCLDSVTGNVWVFTVPDASFTGLKNRYCENDGEAVLVPAMKGGIFSGTGVEGNTFIPKNIGESTITYTIEIDGCEAKTSQLTEVKPQPVISFGSTYSCIKEPIKLDATFPNSTYLWSDGSTQPTNSISVVGNYWVTLFNACDTLTKEIEIKNCFYAAYPNAFSPNSDGVNDIFMPFIRNAHSIELKVFNRWGEVLFETEDFNVGWDGTNKGVSVPDGVYLYSIKLQYFDENQMLRTENHRSTLTLVR